jgi:hypothetical protein
MGLFDAFSQGGFALLNPLGYGGAKSQADAAEQAGQATLDAANKQVQMSQDALQQQIQARADAIKQIQGIAGLSPEEINSINQILTTKTTALNSSLSSIAKQQSQLDAMDPQVKQAGQDLYDLLTGHASAVLAPMQQQMARQRQNMMDSLSSQLGPGFMTSSAGINAIVQFDEQSAVTLQNAQLNAVSQMTSTYGSLAGMQNQGQNAVTSQTGEAFGRAMTADQSVLQANQFATQRMMAGTLGAMSTNPVNFMAPVDAQGNVIANASGPFSGQKVMGQASQAFGNSIFNMVPNMIGASSGGSGGGGGGGGGGGNTFTGSGGYATSPVNGNTFNSAVDYNGPTGGGGSSSGGGGMMSMLPLLAMA